MQNALQHRNMGIQSTIDRSVGRSLGLVGLQIAAECDSPCIGYVRYDSYLILILLHQFCRVDQAAMEPLHLEQGASSHSGARPESLARASTSTASSSSRKERGWRGYRIRPG